VKQYNSLKNELLQISQNLSSLFSAAASVPEIYSHSLKEWEKRCSLIHKQISEEMIRVAVVGTIKSGKSTFVNSILGGDYLKRGAGVVTSIVTRIRGAEELKANLFFKSWDEINRDIEQAITLFPSQEWRSSSVGSSLRLEAAAFDIRKKTDREELRQAIDNLNSEMLISNDTRNMKSLLLSCYLKGYNRVAASDRLTDCYKNKDFTEHKNFAGDDNLAVYLKDILLEIPSGNTDADTEIADCQGSDSPNPFHLAMIQDYLLTTHLIIYVISSRTGMRQADIRFLSVIKKMGILENIIFVINIDFGEHESAEDMDSLIKKIKEDIALIKPEPEIYALSALFNLFKSKDKKLSEKERNRLSRWKKDKELADYSDKETDRFYSVFHRKIKEERSFLLLKNHLERLGVISSHINDWISVNKDIFSKDASGVNEMIEKINQQQKQTDKIKSMIKSTFDGAVQTVKQELKSDVDHFFDPGYGDVLKRLRDFIRNYNVADSGLRHESAEQTDNLIFSNHLYLIFQEFRQSLDMFMAETVNPEIIRFVREEEKKIRENLEVIAGSYNNMIRDTLAEYNRILENAGINPVSKIQENLELPDMNFIKNNNRLTLLPAAASMDYGIQIKTHAVMNLGIHRIFKSFKKLFRIAVDEKEDQIAALKESISRLKKDTEKSLVFHFKDYSENMKFQYIFRLVDAVSGILYDMLLDRFHTYTSDLSGITALMDEKQIDRKEVSKILVKMESISDKTAEKINLMRESIDKS